MNITSRLTKLESQVKPEDDWTKNIIFVAFTSPDEELKPMTPEMKGQVKAEIVRNYKDRPVTSPCVIYLPSGYEAPFDDADCINIIKFARDNRE